MRQRSAAFRAGSAETRVPGQVSSKKPPAKIRGPKGLYVAGEPRERLSGGVIRIVAAPDGSRVRPNHEFARGRVRRMLTRQSKENFPMIRTRRLKYVPAALF